MLRSSPWRSGDRVLKPSSGRVSQMGGRHEIDIESVARPGCGACRLDCHDGRFAGRRPDALLGRMGPGERAGRTVEGLYRRDRHRHEVRVRAVDQLCRPLPQRAQLQGQALRPDHRRQPVDRRLGRERPLRQAQRFLRQGRNQDERLRRRDRRRLFAVAEEHAELLVAAGLWRRGRLDLSQGLVRQAGTSGGVQGKIWP